MQAPGSLSAVQRDSLESSFACFKGIAAFLESIESKLAPEEKLISGNLRELAGVCERKLVEAFPELLEWLREWDGAGVRSERSKQCGLFARGQAWPRSRTATRL
jgi:hypothetical protein